MRIYAKKENFITQYVDRENRFFEIFNQNTGFYLRTGVLNEKGRDTKVDPFKRNFPNLLDIGIMGSCINGKLGLCKIGGIECYQSGNSISKPNMSLTNFKRIIDEVKGYVFQVALGGRGDPDTHKNFRSILLYCRNNDIVPNFTTSGINLTLEKAKFCKEYCGAVAVSWQRAEHTYKAINLLIEEEVKTNIHYVLGNNTIDEAIKILQTHELHKSLNHPKKINAIIFLLHKPVGYGSKKNTLQVDNPKLKVFGELIPGEHPFKIGFDSCSIPLLINYTKGIDPTSFDTCEGGRFSMYISSDMIALPCSFDQEEKWGFNLSKGTIKEAWESPLFEDFRQHLFKSCPKCENKLSCMGGCPIKNEIVLCNKTEKTL